MARVLGLEEDQISWQATGFNHVIYLPHFCYKGEDAYPILDKWIEEKSEEFWRNYQPKYYEHQMSRAAIE